MTRIQYIERIRRQIYGSQPNDDAAVTIGLVNNWINDAVAIAAKTNYKDNLTIDGISFLNNSFYTTFKDISIAADEQFVWKITLPEIPIGIGSNEGVSTLKLKDSDSNQISLPFIPLTANQLTYQQGMRPIPNKVLYYSEGKYLYILSTLLLNAYTANVTIVSGGDSTDLGSTLNVPPDYFPIMTEYLKQQLMFSLGVKVDRSNEGEDVNPSA